MRTNDVGLEIIRHFEGFSPVPYRCPAGIPTIGCGSIWWPEGNALKRVTMDDGPIDEATGEAMLTHLLRRTGWQVAHMVRVKVTENEFTALVSFAYNVGAGALRRSTLRAKLNRSDT